ncbi:MAG TPA: hypothetical protein VF187_02645 [Gemmatimonadales bacterium]
MIPARRGLWGSVVLLFLAVNLAPAQGYRVRLDSRVQGVSWRGLTAGTIPRADAVQQPNGGFLTPDGHAAICGENTCTYFAAGPVLRGIPWVTSADISIWGVGAQGLSLRANARWATDLGDKATWPGNEPEFQLVEGYLEYAGSGVTARAGRQFLTGRLGAYGLDGARVAVRDAKRGVELTGYLGWGLDRGSVLPVTDPALNPLNDFQPRNRQVVAGVEAAFTSSLLDARAEYRREVDPSVDYFVSERAAASVALRPLQRLSVMAGGEYDLAFGEVGGADASVTWIGRRYTLTGGARRYRPFFDLWTIWGAFSPVPYHAIHGSASVTPVTGLTIRARGERYRFEDAEVFTPGVSVEDRGWRFESGVSWAPAAQWVLDGGYQAEFGPGASSRGFTGRVTWQPTPEVSVSAHGARLQRPLELRFNDAELTTLGLDAEYRPDARWRVGLQASRYNETRDRPDTSALDWDQFRVAGRISLMFGSNADRLRLPPAARSR